MRCPACGAFYKKHSARCPECGAIQSESLEPSLEVQSDQGVVEEATVPTNMQKRIRTRKNPSLIEFPGINRSALPEWRKELGERVREVQERRAREAVIHTGGDG